MKTAVETIFVGKDRQYNRRFLQMCSHHLVEPVACTPASGWEKGQVENQVGLVRGRFLTPRLRFKSYDELNAWLMDKCIAWAKAHPHPEQPDRTIWEVFEEERPKLVPYRGRFDGFHALPASVSKTCLVRFDNNKYSVSASAVGRPVDIHAYAERVVIRQDGRIVIRQDGRIVAEHPRRYGRGATVYDPWHYVPVLARKPDALRNGAVQGLGAADGPGPRAAQACRVRRRRPADGENPRRRTHHGLLAVEAACLQAPSEGVHSADVVINILARQRDPGRRRQSRRPTLCGSATRRSSTAPLRSTQELLTHGTKRSPRHDERPQALRDGGAYDETLATAIKRKHEPQRFVGDLLKAEISEKQARSIKYQLTVAKLPLAKDVDDFTFKNTPINEALVRDPAGGGCIV